MVVFLIWVLRLSPQPQRVRQAWEWFQIALENGNPGVAASSLDQIATAYPWREDLRWAAARYALQAGNWEDGIRWMGMLDPSRLSAQDWLKLGDAHWARGDWRMAEQSWENARLLDPSEAVFERLYRIHRLQKDLPKTIADLQHLVRLDPEDWDWSYQLAVHLVAYDPVACINWLRQLPIADDRLTPEIKLMKNQLGPLQDVDQPAWMFFVAGQTLIELQEWQLAKVAFEKALQYNPEFAEAWSFLGEVRQHLEPPETEQALRDLQHGLFLKPNSPLTLSTLALYRQRQREYDRATELYRSAAVLEPLNPTWFVALGALENGRGNLSSAEWHYWRAVQLSPQKAIYWRLLAQFYILNQIQIREKALDAARRAVDLEPENPENLDTLGQVYLLLDQRDVARSWFYKALKINPSFAASYLHLGIADLFDGRTQQAYQFLTIARQLSADPVLSDQAERLLSYYFP